MHCLCCCVKQLPFISSFLSHFNALGYKENTSNPMHCTAKLLIPLWQQSKSQLFVSSSTDNDGWVWHVARAMDVVSYRPSSRRHPFVFLFLIPFLRSCVLLITNYFFTLFIRPLVLKIVLIYFELVDTFVSVLLWLPIVSLCRSSVYLWRKFPLFCSNSLSFPIPSPTRCLFIHPLKQISCRYSA